MLLRQLSGFRDYGIPCTINNTKVIIFQHLEQEHFHFVKITMATYPSKQIINRSVTSKPHADTQAFCLSYKYKHYCKSVSNYSFSESEVHMTAFHLSLVKAGCGIHIHLKVHAAFISRCSNQLPHTAPEVTWLSKVWEDQAANLLHSIRLL